MARPARVALLIDTSSTWGAEIIQGIAHYAQTVARWLLQLEPVGKFDAPRLPRDWAGEGVIARVTTQALADQIVRAGLRAVNVSWYQWGRGHIPRCTADEEGAARLAADHFHERGLRQFAYCGSWLRADYVDRLARSFVPLAPVGTRCPEFRPLTRLDEFPWERQLEELGGWLVSLPRPVGVFAFDSIVGRRVIEACHLRGLRVPEDVAVLSCEHDELFSSLSSPALSGIDLAPRRIGYEAAALLDRCMNGEAGPNEEVLLSPAGVVLRGSTETFAVEDEGVAAAVRFIREYAHKPIRVCDVLREVGLSRRALEQRFSKAVGRSLGAEIRLRRLEAARALLRETSLNLAEVAIRSGFGSVRPFARAFRRAEGTTPAAYRRLHQPALCAFP